MNTDTAYAARLGAGRDHHVVRRHAVVAAQSERASQSRFPRRRREQGREGADHRRTLCARRSASSPPMNSRAAVRPRAATRWRGCISPAELRVTGLSSPAATTAAGSRPSTSSASPRKLPATWIFTGKAGNVDAQAGPTTTSPAAACSSPPRRSRTPSWCSSATASKRPSTSGTTSRASTCKGKVLVMLNNDPDWDPKLFAGKTRLYYGRWTYKYESAARHGAAGVIIVHTTPSAGYPWQVVQSSWGGEQFELPAEGEPRIQLKGWATEDAARRLVKAGGADLDKLVDGGEEPQLQARAARPAHLDQVRQQGLARAHRERRGPAAGQRSEAQGRSGDLFRAPRSLRHRRAGQDRRQDLQRRRGQCRRAARRCWPSRAPWRRCPSGRAVRC